MPPFNLRLDRARLVTVVTASLFVIACSAALLHIYDITWRQMLIFAGYELLFICVPGCLLYSVLTGGSGSLARQLAVGVALGHVLEIVAFVLTAAIGRRELFVLYPPLFIGCFLLFLWRQQRKCRGVTLPNAEPFNPLHVWASASLCVLCIALLGIRYFSEMPLPQTIQNAYYNIDNIWSLGLAAEAKHHWPILDPNVSGEPLTYYTFVFMHIAAISQVTGLELPLVFFRLYPVPIYIVLALQLYVLGRQVGGSRSCGWLTVALALLTADITFFRFSPYPFHNVLIYHLCSSHTLLLGMVFFLALILELQTRIEAHTFQVRQLGSWIAIALLMGAAGGTKGVILPVVLGGLSFYAVWRSAAQRRLTLAPFIGLGLLLLIYLPYQFLIYKSVASRVELTFFANKSLMPALKWFLARYPLDQAGVLASGYQILLAIVGVGGLLGVRSWGLYWLCRYSLTRFSPSQQWCFALFLSGLIPLLLFSLTSGAELIFFWHGYVAVCALSAAGLVALWKQKVKLRLVICLLLLLSFIYPALPMRLVERKLQNRPTYPQIPTLTYNLAQGLTWVRDHTAPSAVLAVNNLYDTEIKYEGEQRAYYFYYPAFTERRVFLSSWMYTTRTMQIGHAKVKKQKIQPFPERYSLNQRLFQQADQRALDIIRRDYGVQYLLVDKIHGTVHPQLAQMLSSQTRRVFSNSDIDIYEVRASS